MAVTFHYRVQTHFLLLPHMGMLYTKMAAVNWLCTCAMWTYDVIENAL